MSGLVGSVKAGAGADTGAGAVAVLLSLVLLLMSLLLCGWVEHYVLWWRTRCATTSQQQQQQQQQQQRCVVDAGTSLRVLFFFRHLWGLRETTVCVDCAVVCGSLMFSVYILLFV